MSVIIRIVERGYEPDPHKQEYVKVADSGNQRDGGAAYEWVVKPSAVQSTERVLLHQEFKSAAEIDMEAIIKAVNGL